MTFRVGQKVRIVRAVTRRDMIGSVVTVEEIVLMTEARQSLWNLHGVHDAPPLGSDLYRIAESGLLAAEHWLAPIPDDTVSADDEISEILPRTIRDLCSAGTAERAKRKAGV